MSLILVLFNRMFSIYSIDLKRCLILRVQGTVNEVGVRCRRIDKNLWFGPTLTDEGFEAAVTMSSGIGSRCGCDSCVVFYKGVFNISLLQLGGAHHALESDLYRENIRKTRL